jgi:hypothetical protein
MSITPPIEAKSLSPLGEAVPASQHGLQISPLNRRRWQLAELQGQPPRLLVVLDFLDPVHRLAVRGIDRERPAVSGRVRRASVFYGLRDLSGNGLRW